jgi:hypothetical protein
LLSVIRLRKHNTVLSLLRFGSSAEPKVGLAGKLYRLRRRNDTSRIFGKGRTFTMSAATITMVEGGE